MIQVKIAFIQALNKMFSFRGKVNLQYFFLKIILLAARTSLLTKLEAEVDRIILYIGS